MQGFIPKMQDLQKPMTYKAQGQQEFSDTFPIYKHAQEAGLDVAENCVDRCKINMLREGLMQEEKKCMQQCYVKFFDAVLTLKYQLEFRSESMEGVS